MRVRSGRGDGAGGGGEAAAGLREGGTRGVRRGQAPLGPQRESGAAARHQQPSKEGKQTGRPALDAEGGDSRGAAATRAPFPSPGAQREPSGSVLTRAPQPRPEGAPAVLDRWHVTLIALGGLIDTPGVKRTLEITNKRANYHVGLERASLKIYPLHV